MKEFFFETLTDPLRLIYNLYLIYIMDVDQVRSEITLMMNSLQQQLDYLDDIFEKEQEKIRIEKQENCFSKFFNQIFKRE